MMRRSLVRKTGGYSLEEAARIRRAVEQSGSPQCPSCRVTMARMVGDNGAGDVWLLQCRVCRRSLVLRGIVPHGDPPHPAPRSDSPVLATR
jgi:hypothetical protein